MFDRNVAAHMPDSHSLDANCGDSRLPRRGPWLRRCATTLIIGMTLYIAVAWWSARAEMHSAVRFFSVATLLPVLGLVLLGITLRVARWHYFTGRLRWRLPLTHSALAFLASLAFTATPGKVGEAAKIILLRERHEVGVPAGVGMLIVERLGDVVAVLILSIAGIALLSGGATYVLLVAIAVSAATIFIASGLYAPLFGLIRKVRYLRSIAARAVDALDACKLLLKPMPFLVGAGLAIVAWSCEAVAFMHLARVAGFQLGLLPAASIYGTATLAGVLSALPGGIGGFEAVMALLLSRAGQSIATAMPVIIVFRLCTLWFGILIGLVAMLAWMVSFRPRVNVSDLDAQKAVR